MPEFETSMWSSPEFAQSFMEAADLFIPDRRKMMAILKSFYQFFLQKENKTNRLLELGSGHGSHTLELLKLDPALEATLVDGSAEMLTRAKERLSDFPRTHFMQLSFQKLIRNDPFQHSFDFIFSAMAIHHLPLDDKRRMFDFAFNHLEKGGWFVNIDMSLAPDARLEDWYLFLWKEQILEMEKRHPQTKSNVDVITRYKESKDDMPDTLSDQVATLRAAGFGSADCFYKHGVFAMYGGQKER